MQIEMGCGRGNMVYTLVEQEHRPARRVSMLWNKEGVGGYMDGIGKSGEWVWWMVRSAGSGY